MNLKEIKLTIRDDLQHNVYHHLSDWKTNINNQIDTFGSIIRKDEKYYFNSMSDGYIELDLNDIESVGALITNSIAKHLLESKDEDK